MTAYDNKGLCCWHKLFWHITITVHYNKVCIVVVAVTLCANRDH